MKTVSQPGRPDTRKAAVTDLLEEVVDSLRFYAAAGYIGGDCRSDNLARLKLWDAPICLSTDSLERIRQDVAACSRCESFQKTVDPVPGAGPVSAGLMFIGDWPASDADRGNDLFSGETGRLLTAMIAAMKLPFESVYVTCLIKCRPSGATEPEPSAIEQCRTFLEREIALISPEIICALGENVARRVLDTSAPWATLQGRFHKRNGIAVMPTWHPADILEQKARKRPLWEDLKKIMAGLKTARPRHQA